MADVLARVRREVVAIACYPGQRSWRDLRAALIEAADFLRVESDETSPPIRVEKIAPRRRIWRAAPFRDLSAPDAVLLPVRNGFIIRLAPGRPVVRQRASIAHEIGHTFFYDLDRRPPVRLLARHARRLDVYEEEVCWAFARALLMPAELVLTEEKLVATLGDLEKLVHFSKLFRVSAELAARRLLWDLARLEHTVVLVRGVHVEEVTRRAPRSVVGRKIRQKLGHKSITAVLHRVREVLASGPPFSQLEQLAGDYRRQATLEWRFAERGPEAGVIAVLSFAP